MDNTHPSDDGGIGKEDLGEESRDPTKTLSLEGAPHGFQDWRESDELPRLSTDDYPDGHFAQRVAAISLIVVHHTGTNDEIQAANKYSQERNWNPGAGPAIQAPHIPYHYYIDAGGRLIACNQLWERTWHAARANDLSIGVALAGELQSHPPREAQLTTLRWLLAQLHPALRLDRSAVVAHGELTPFGNSTNCPGPSLRSAIAGFRDGGHSAAG
jgi:hypothetical protein